MLRVNRRISPLIAVSFEYSEADRALGSIVIFLSHMQTGMI